MAVDRSAGDDSDPLLSALGEVLEATRVLQRALRDSEERTVRNMGRLRSGERLVVVVRVAPYSKARMEINEALDRLTAARQRSRGATFHRLVDEGLSRKEIASNWGFSQTVVSRIINRDDASE